jgi:uncharacterized protein (DUF885 family)
MMYRPSRRAVIAGGGLAALAYGTPLAASVDADNSLRVLLDAAAAGENVLPRLERFDPATLSPSSRLDLLTARSGLRIDAELARRFPDPKGPMTPERYTLLVRRITADDTDPRASLARLNRELRNLLASADRKMVALGVRGGSVGDRFTRLWQDDRWLYSDDDAGRDRAVADMNRTLASARGLTKAALPNLPARCYDVSVKRMSATDEAAGRGGYRVLPTASTSGSYTVDLKTIRRRPSWTLPSVVYHELLPGHMVQMPLEAIAAPHPLRLKYAPGFAEGWAIHAEQLGVYADDPMAMLGHIHWLLFRTGRAISDINIHVLGWNTARMREKLAEWQGEPAYFAPFDTDLARISTEPGLRLAEALSWLTISDLPNSRQHSATLAHGRMRNDELKKS